MAMKWCINCDALFVPHKRESDAQWARRRFCSRRCARRYLSLRKDTGLKSGPCEDCGEVVVGLILGACKPCWDKRRYKAQRDRLLALDKRWREANPDYWKQPHIRVRNRQWLRDHPDAAKKHARAAKRRRRALSAGRSVEQMRDTEAYVEVLGADVCAYCGGPAESVDHIDALTSGGDHVWENMTAACRSCNSKKRTASLLTFLLRSY
jgi:5-methylcytosine-specific restriction endonuclease McrA